MGIHTHNFAAMFIRFFKQVAPNGDLKRRYSWQKSTTATGGSTSSSNGGIARRSTAAVDKDSSSALGLSRLLLQQGNGKGNGCGIEQNPTALCTSPTANSHQSSTTTSSSICGATTNNEADRLDIKLQEDGSTVQTVDLVADCPEPANADVTILPVAATAAASAAAPIDTETISPSDTSSDKNCRSGERNNEENIRENVGMGQKSSSLGLLRPKISLTWVLRDQPHLQQQHQHQQQYQHSFHNHYHNHHDNNNSSSKNNNNNNNDLIYANSMELTECKFSLSNSQRVQDVRAEIHTQKELVNRQRAAVKEREVEKERMFRRSVKSVKSVKSLKSMKNAKKAAAAERARNNAGDNKENRMPNAVDAAALNRIDNIEVVETCFENVAAKDYELEKRAAANASKNIYEIIAKGGNEAIASHDDKVKRAISEPNLNARDNGNINNKTTKTTTTTTASTSSNSSSSVGRHNRRKKRSKSKFGCYAIADLDSFLTKASIEQPANVPVVLTFPTTLYQTQGGTQAELALPLGCVVNAVFKNQAWLYVQTAHGQEGYVNYTACLPLGILPQSSASASASSSASTSTSGATSRRQHCWDDPTDVFPRPLGNLTDMEKLQDTRSECGGRKSASSALRQRRPQSAIPSRNPKSTSSTTSSLSSSSGTPSTSTTASRCPSEIGSGSRSSGASKKKIATSSGSQQQLQQQKRLLHTLLLVRENYQAEQQQQQQQQPTRFDQVSSATDALSVNKGEVVLLLGEHRPDADGRYRVRAKDGREGFIPAAVAAHGFL
ncbi:myb-like protein U [Trichogramma pretiosum]|uniref:myb-like protein U n=1 Tax=Trichogramma pretiosum TaxID=7493 RepID=UPI0006C9CBB2|nr:myb-like protein U [Trichogramma pretiosum]